MKWIKIKIVNFIYDYIYIPILFNIVYIRDLKKMKSAYGKFENLSRAEQKKYTLLYDDQSKNVCGLIVPEIVKIILDLSLQPNKVLLDGDNKLVIDQFKKRFNFSNAEVVTVGEEGNFDYQWNFEDDCPKDMPSGFDLIVSQAMFEHLIDPYKHFKDLTALLKSGGYLVIHTHIPGYTYHRYPIDAVRFFPDWFEVSAKKNNLAVRRKFIRNFHIIYLFEKI
jgi:hypothetical protein